MKYQSFKLPCMTPTNNNLRTYLFHTFTRKSFPSGIPTLTHPLRRYDFNRQEADMSKHVGPFPCVLLRPWWKNCCCCRCCCWKNDMRWGITLIISTKMKLTRERANAVEIDFWKIGHLRSLAVTCSRRSLAVTSAVTCGDLQSLGRSLAALRRSLVVTSAGTCGQSPMTVYIRVGVPCGRKFGKFLIFSRPVPGKYPTFSRP